MGSPAPTGVRDAVRPGRGPAGPRLRRARVRGRHRFVLTAHHIVCDGWSSAVLFSEVGRLYAADCLGIPAQLGPAASYEEYVAEQMSHDQVAAAAADEEHWAAQYADGAPVLDLPLSRSPPAHEDLPQRPRGPADRRRAVRRDQADRSTVRSARSSQPLVAACEALVYRLSGQSDFVVGIPFAGQPQLENSDARRPLRQHRSLASPPRPGCPVHRAPSDCP